jgi:hypothetical protein
MDRGKDRKGRRDGRSTERWGYRAKRTEEKEKSL